MKLNTKRLSHFKNKVTFGYQLTKQQALVAFYIFSATYFPLSANSQLFKSQDVHPYFRKVIQNYEIIQEQFNIKNPKEWKKQIFLQLIKQSEEQYKSYSESDWRVEDQLRQKVLINYFSLELFLKGNQLHEQAKEILEKAKPYTREESIGYLYFCLAKHCLQISHFEEGLVYIQNAINSEQQNESFYCLKGLIKFQSFQYEDALIIFENVLSRNPKNQHALYGKAGCLYKLENYNLTYQFLIRTPIIYYRFISQFIQILRIKDKINEYRFLQSVYPLVDCQQIRQETNNQKQILLFEKNSIVQQTNQLVLNLYNYQRCMQVEDYFNALEYLKQLLKEKAFENRILYLYRIYVQCSSKNRIDITKQIFKVFHQIQEEYVQEQSYSKISKNVEKNLQSFINYFLLSMCYLIFGQVTKGLENMSKIFAVLRVLKVDNQSRKSNIIDKVICAVCSFKNNKNFVRTDIRTQYILQYISWLKDQDRYDRSHFLKLISFIKRQYSIQNQISYEQIFVIFYTKQLERQLNHQGLHMKMMISLFFVSQIMRINESEGIKIYKYLVNRQKQFQYTSELSSILSKCKGKDMKYLYYLYTHSKQILSQKEQQEQEKMYQQFIMDDTINSLNQFLKKQTLFNKLIKDGKNVGKLLNIFQKFIEITILQKGHQVLDNQNKYVLIDLINMIPHQQYLKFFESDLSIKEIKRYLKKCLIKLEIIKKILGDLSPYFQKYQIQKIKDMFAQFMKDECNWNKIDKCILSIVGQNQQEQKDEQELQIICFSQKKYSQIGSQQQELPSQICNQSQSYVASQMSSISSHQQFYLQTQKKQSKQQIKRLYHIIANYSVSLIRVDKFCSVKFDQTAMKIKPRLKFLLMKNFYLIINCLTRLKNSYPKHLIKFYNTQQWSHSKEQAFSKLKFDVIMENGEQIPQQIQKQYVCDRDTQMKMFILSKGKQLGFYQFIIQFANSIIQLQQLGLFHMDLAFRNMVFINRTLKIIDFDKSLKVRLNQRGSLQQELLMHTKAICKYLLDFYFKDNSYDITPDFLYVRIDHPTKEYSLNKIRKKLKEGLRNISSVNRKADYYFEFLEEYSREFHLFNYCKLVKQLIKTQYSGAKFLSTEEREYLSIKLDLLREGQIDYHNFVNCVNDLRDCDNNEKLSLQLVKDLLLLNPDYKEDVEIANQISNPNYRT